MELQTESPTMNTEPNLVVSRVALEWLALASTASIPGRSMLNYGRLFRYEDRTYLATTDTHRAHFVKVEGGDARCDLCIDIRRVLYECRYYRSVTDVSFSFGPTGKLLVQLLDRDGKPVETVDRCVSVSSANYPDITRIVPKFDDVNAATPPSAFNFIFLSDASKMARQGANRVHLMGQLPTRPFVITPLLANPWVCDWFAVIMPMAVAVPTIIKEITKPKRTALGKKAA